MEPTPVIRFARGLTPLASALLLSLGTALHAQQANPPSAADAAAASADNKDDETIMLSPFEVRSDSSTGYMATSSLAGSRLNTSLKDISSAIQVITPQFMQDTGATKVDTLLTYTTNTEVAGPHGNYFGSYANDGSLITNRAVRPQTATRVRGLNNADLTRDFWVTDIPLDAYNVERVEVQRGPNSVLYGLGSPAGIINYTLKTPNMVKNKYGLELRVSSYGGNREAIDLDQAIVPNVLGLRVNALDENEKFRVDDKYARSQRLTLTPRWTPKLADSVYTQITGSFEFGHTDSNRPVNTPPLDFISTWYDNLGKWKHTSGDPNYPSDAQSVFFVPYNGSGNGNWWDQLGVVFSDPNSSATGGAGIPDAWRQRGGATAAWGAWLNPGNYHEDYWTSNPLHPLAQKATYANNPRALAIINDYEAQTGRTFTGFGPGLWQGQQITDPSVFDYWNDDVAGPNNTQFNNFRAMNLDLVQTYLNGRTGIQLTYDKQEYNDGYHNLMSDPFRLGVDINAVLRDGTPNPNFGRIWTVSGTDAHRNEERRENTRGTIFYKFKLDDYLPRRNVFARIFGEQTFTGTASRQRYSHLGYSWSLYDEGPTLRQYMGDGVAGVHYFNSRVNPADASHAAGLGIQGLGAAQMPGTQIQANLIDGVNQTFPDWSTKSVDLITEATSPLSDLYGSGAASAYRDQTDTRSFTWQAKFLDDTIVGLFGLRKDNYEKQDKGPAPRTATQPQRDLPFSPDWVYTDAGTIHASQTTRSWGWMFHSPEFINKRLPWGSTISVGYNQASNFRPADVGFDIYRQPLASPSGESKDWTLLVTTLDDRVAARVTWYKTVQKNTSGAGLDIGLVQESLSRTLNALMIEAWNNQGTKNRQQTTPEWIVNKWFFGDSYDKGVAGQSLAAYEASVGKSSWAALSDAERQTLMNQPLRVRDAAGTITGPGSGIDPKSIPAGLPYFEPPVSADEIAYRKAWFQAQPDTEWFRPFNTVPGLDLASALNISRNPTYAQGDGGADQLWTTAGISNFKNTADIVSKGVELEITANITSNWRVTFNGSRDEASQANLVGGNTAVYMDVMRAIAKDGYSSADIGANIDYWSRRGFAQIDEWGDEGGHNNNQYLGTKWVANTESRYLAAKASEGRSIQELHKYRFNVITSYDFKRGFLRGVGVGGAVRYQDRATIGYYPKYNKDADAWLADLDSPITAPSQTNFDAWISYHRKIWKDIDWSVQLNIRNLFAKKELIPISTNPDGSYGQFAIPELTSWELSTRFEF